MYVINNKSNGVVRMYVTNFVTNKPEVRIDRKSLHTYALRVRHCFYCKVFSSHDYKVWNYERKKKEEDAIKRPQQNF